MRTTVAPKIAWSHMISANDIPISSFQKRVITGIGKSAARSPLAMTSRGGFRSAFVVIIRYGPARSNGTNVTASVRYTTTYNAQPSNRHVVKSDPTFDLATFSGENFRRDEEQPVLDFLAKLPLRPRQSGVPHLAQRQEKATE